MQGLKFTPATGWATSLPASSAGTASGTAIALHDCRQVAYTLTGSGTVTDGVVKFESSDTADYAGTWYEIDSIDFSSQTLTDAKWQAPPFPAGLGGFYRLRISSAITSGGTITGTINGLLQ